MQKFTNKLASSAVLERPEMLNPFRKKDNREINGKLLDLLARAFFSYLKNSHGADFSQNQQAANDKAIAQFLEYMEKSANAPHGSAEIASAKESREIASLKDKLNQAQAERDKAIASRNADAQQFNARIGELQQEVAEWKQKAAAFEKIHTELSRELDMQLEEKKHLRECLEEEKTNLRERLERAAAFEKLHTDKTRELAVQIRENEDLIKSLKSATKQLLNDQQYLYDLQSFLASLGTDARKITGNYFNLDNLAIFLSQAGQFQKISLCWEACARAVAQGAEAGLLAGFLIRLIGLYNNASGDSQAILIEPEPDSPYQSEHQHRIASNGTHVAKTLLPGLRNAGGKLIQPALVLLK